MRPGALGAFQRLARELSDAFAEGVDRPWSEDRFQRRALGVFQHQFRWNPVYRSFCRRRGVDPRRIGHWQEIPPVPTSAFKALPLRSVPLEAVERIFRTSGTTGGEEGRGAHHVPSLSLYRASSLPNLGARVLEGLVEPTTAMDPPPGGDAAGVPILCLLPPPHQVPDSSLSAMMGFALRRWGGPDSGWFVDPGRGLRLDDLRDALTRAATGGRPVLVAGTAFSFVHLLDSGLGRAGSLHLPGGSRVMETGGFKGRSREVARPELYRGIQDLLGVPMDRIVNEYGMTELLSQFYEPVLEEGTGPDDPEGRHHVAPPWVRTRVLDPRTLDPLPAGEPGLLCHMDLANLGSVSHVLTEDLGVAVGGGFRVLGRVRGAEPRGCSLAMEELMAASGEGA